MAYVPTLKKKYQEEVIPSLKKEFNYTSVMQVPKLEKIVLNQGVGAAIADKKIIEVATHGNDNDSGQKAVQTMSKKDISNFKLRKKMPIGVRVTLRRDRMFEFLGSSDCCGFATYSRFSWYRKQNGRKRKLYTWCSGTNCFPGNCTR